MTSGRADLAPDRRGKTFLGGVAAVVEEPGEWRRPGHVGQLVTDNLVVSARASRCVGQEDVVADCGSPLANGGQGTLCRRTGHDADRCRTGDRPCEGIEPAGEFPRSVGVFAAEFGQEARPDIARTGSLIDGSGRGRRPRLLVAVVVFSAVTAGVVMTAVAYEAGRGRLRRCRDIDGSGAGLVGGRDGQGK